MLPHHGVGELQLIQPVQHLGDLAGGGVDQGAQAQRVAVGVHGLQIGAKNSGKIHTVHHLGVTLTAVMPPLQLIFVSPSGRVGHSMPAMDTG